MTTNNSMLGRAVLAVALTVCFYGLALVLGLGLLAGPVILYAASGLANLWLALAMVAGGLTILRALVPVRQRFEPPGPELTRTAHPQLHALLDSVAQATGERPADHVYLDIDVNAAVAEDRGRRVMVLGLPLLAALDADELRAVIAHEYGHYAAGDTRFSRWIWRTRTAILRTVSALARSGSTFQRSLVKVPFEAYAKLFLRITNAISRRAEFAADALAAQIASPAALATSLRRVSAADAAYRAFWRLDFEPMLAAGKRPPLAVGFRMMATHADVRADLDDVVRADLEAGEANVYASTRRCASACRRSASRWTRPRPKPWRSRRPHC